TVASIAQRFKVSAQTVQWANNLVGNSVTAGTVLDIPPIDGVIYITKTGDTAQSIAQRYSANASRIISYNDLEISGVKPG
ncbi:MAG TPA: LysM peptidoglycan-binding domain-containing protein, partial [Candidatus Saccharibacteria bacterium]|nr:LysM peptidoglycan-binding domain-containing protein [Candidatus Saccharibacteria bacterium]